MCTSNISFAQPSNSTELLKKGVYIGGSVDWMRRDTLPNEDIWDSAGEDTLTGVGARAFLGYQINNHYAVEAGYTLVNSFRNEYGSTFGANDAGTTSFYMGGYDLSALYHMPFHNGLDFYLRGGAIVYHIKYNNYTDYGRRIDYHYDYYRAAPLIGAGINFVSFKRWPLGLEATYTPAIHSSVPSVLMIGLRSSLTL